MLAAIARRGGGSLPLLFAVQSSSHRSPDAQHNSPSLESPYFGKFGSFSAFTEANSLSAHHCPITANSMNWVEMVEIRHVALTFWRGWIKFSRGICFVTGTQSVQSQMTCILKPNNHLKDCWAKRKGGKPHPYGRFGGRDPAGDAGVMETEVNAMMRKRRKSGVVAPGGMDLPTPL